MFGPTLLKTTEGSASLSSLVDTVHQTRVVELLTKHASSIFGASDSLPTNKGHGWEGRRRARQSHFGNNDSERQQASDRLGLRILLYLFF